MVFIRDTAKKKMIPRTENRWKEMFRQNSQLKKASMSALISEKRKQIKGKKGERRCHSVTSELIYRP